MTRQRRWQLRKQVQGLCIICGKEKIFMSDRCREHVKIHKESLRVLNGNIKRYSNTKFTRLGGQVNI